MVFHESVTLKELGRAVIKAQRCNDLAVVLRIFEQVNSYLSCQAKTPLQFNTKLRLHPYIVAMAHKVKNLVLMNPDSDYLRAVRCIEAFVEGQDGYTEILQTLVG